MPKRIPPHISTLQAEGNRNDRSLIREEIQQEAKRLADKMPTFPPDRLIYIRNLVQEVLQKQLDLEVFKLFIKMTNSYMELQTCMPRARKLMER